MNRRIRWEYHQIRVRWFALIVASAWALTGAPAEDQGFRPLLFAATLLFGVAYNTGYLFLLRARYRPQLTLPGILCDCVLATMAMAATGGATSPLYILFLLPILAASAIYRLAGVVAVSLLCVLLYFGVVQTSPDSTLTDITSLFNGLLFLFFGFIGVQLSREGQMHDEQIRRLEFLSDVDIEAGSPDHVIKQLLPVLSQVLDCELAFILHCRPAGERLALMAGWVRLTSAQVDVLGGAGQQERWRQHLGREDVVLLEGDAAGEMLPGCRNLALAAIGHGETPFGLLVVADKRRGRVFTSFDGQILGTVAAQAAVVFSQASTTAMLDQERSTIEAILGNLSSGVVVTDVDGNVLVSNAATPTLLRLEGEEIRGRNVEDVLATTAVREHVLQGLRSPSRHSVEVSIEDPRPMVLRIDCSPVYRPDGEHLGHALIFTDVSELRRLDRLKSDFINAVSHELRTPLTSIKAFTATLLRDPDIDADKRREFLSVIDTQCNRLTDLINDLLQVSRIDSGTPPSLNIGEVDLVDLATKVCAQQRQLTERHELTVDVPESCRTIRADKERLKQILTNLVDNAVKYSPEGGPVQLAARRDNGTVTISVADHGVGIPSSHLPYVFDKFYQVDGSTTRRVGGSGLGLYLVNHLVEAHHGTIWVESQEDSGSTFYCRLPQDV